MKSNCFLIIFDEDFQLSFEHFLSASECQRPFNLDDILGDRVFLACNHKDLLPG